MAKCKENEKTDIKLIDNVDIYHRKRANIAVSTDPWKIEEHKTKQANKKKTFYS